MTFSCFFGCFHGEPLRAGRSERPDMEAAPAFGGGRKGNARVSRAVRMQCEYSRKMEDVFCVFFFRKVLTLWFLTVLLIFGIPWKGWRDQVDQVCCKSVGSSSHRKKTVQIWTGSSFLPTFNFWSDKSVPLGRPLRRYQARAWARALPERLKRHQVSRVDRWSCRCCSCFEGSGRSPWRRAKGAKEVPVDVPDSLRASDRIGGWVSFFVQTWVKLESTESTFQAWAAAKAAETAAQRLAGTLLYGFGASGCAVKPQVAHLSRWPRLIRHLIWEWWAAEPPSAVLLKLYTQMSHGAVQYSVMCESVWCWNV